MSTKVIIQGFTTMIRFVKYLFRQPGPRGILIGSSWNGYVTVEMCRRRLGVESTLDSFRGIKCHGGSKWVSLGPFSQEVYRSLLSVICRMHALVVDSMPVLPFK